MYFVLHLFSEFIIQKFFSASHFICNCLNPIGHVDDLSIYFLNVFEDDPIFDPPLPPFSEIGIESSLKGKMV